MFCAEFIAGVLAGVEGTLEELAAGVEDHGLEEELSSIVGEIAGLRQSIYPNTEADVDEASGSEGSDAPPIACR
ncbi:MAG: hypothetical protein GY953_14060 [bacterium]|nr:hypothetical protein [bacterium]